MRTRLYVVALLASLTLNATCAAAVVISDPRCFFFSDDYIRSTHPEGMFARAQAAQAGADGALWMDATSRYLTSDFFDPLSQEFCAVHGNFLHFVYGSVPTIDAYKINVTGIGFTTVLNHMSTTRPGTNESNVRLGSAFHLDFNEFRFTATNDPLSELSMSGANVTFSFVVPPSSERESDTHVILHEGTSRVHVIVIGDSGLAVSGTAVSATVRDGIAVLLKEDNETDPLSIGFLRGLVHGALGARLAVSTVLDGSTVQIGSSYGAVLASQGWWGDGLTIRISSERNTGALLLLDIDTANLPMRNVTGIHVDWNHVPIPAANVTDVAAGPPSANAATTMASGHARALVWLPSLGGNDSVTVHFEHPVPPLPPLAPQAATSAATALGTAIALGIAGVILSWRRERR